MAATTYKKYYKITCYSHILLALAQHFTHTNAITPRRAIPFFLPSTSFLFFFLSSFFFLAITNDRAISADEIAFGSVKIGSVRHGSVAGPRGSATFRFTASVSFSLSLSLPFVYMRVSEIYNNRALVTRSRRVVSRPRSCLDVRNRKNAPQIGERERERETHAAYDKFVRSCY